MTSSLRCQILTAPPARQGVFEQRVAIVIPARNEARHLPALLAACRQVEPAVILVVDDASEDATAEVLEAASRGAGASLAFLRNEARLGKQGAVRRALRALEPLALDGVALIDGDGQHDPGELPGLAALLRGHDLVLGVRARTEMPLSRRLSNWLVDRAFAWLAGVELGDVQSGLRLMRKPLADALAARLPGAGGYALEHESLAVLAGWAAERGQALSLVAAPIACRYRGSRSGIRPWHVVQLGAESVRQALRLRRAGEALTRREVRPCQPLA
ncbi:MAG TPA: glycosyltransferase family 2 protein [Myxococcota bacterium]|nr:glycosyltransferase family 2 protein [Myxococcota bacterium]HRY94964.1 glycosyltransferase family 2 protein [Myxococcota bacterium]HSA19973.1 glycosyltransferase family 2 protein [Myxococcota bacterium]